MEDVSIDTRASDKRMGALRWAVALFLAGIVICNCAAQVRWFVDEQKRNNTLSQPCDLKVRYNEMLCIHRGVNPFHVWNREVQDEQFHGLARPDLDGPDAVMDFDKSVHAYPPWHTTYFWWYGWLPYGYVVAVFFLLTGFSLAALFLFFRRRQPESLSARALYWSLLSYLYSESIFFLVISGNYGGLNAGLLVLFLFAIRKNHHVLAGVTWAVMMIKPQLAILLFWPLLIQRRFVTIGVAAGTCLAAVALPAAVLHETPVELIRQTLAQGIPYVGSPAWWRWADPWLGASSNLVRMGLFSVLCGWISWRIREVKPEIFRFVAPFVVLPVWFYCPNYDQIMTWLAAALVLWWLFNLPRKGFMWLFACWLPCVAFKSAWWVARRFAGFNVVGIGWIYHAVDVVSILIAAFVFFDAIRQLERRAAQGHIRAEAPTEEGLVVCQKGMPPLTTP